jgi:DNA-binding NarL/FixJ family response regulator
VDNHPVFREGLVASLAAEPDLAVCCSVGRTSDALQCLAEGSADMAVVDMALAEGSGMELIGCIQARRPGFPVLVLSVHDEAVYAERALSAGARGYVTKSEPATTVVAAIRHVLAGGIYLSEAMSGRILHAWAGGTAQAGTSPIERLTDRELEVFERIGRGIPTRQIAEQLRVSVKTVEAHRAHIKDKLGLKGGNELSLFAIHWMRDRGLS